MAKLPYSWNKVSPGDIISFIYENREGRKLRRTILVLDPKLRNKAKNPGRQYLVHGIQLEVSNQPTLTPTPNRCTLILLRTSEYTGETSQNVLENASVGERELFGKKRFGNHVDTSIGS